MQSLPACPLCQADYSWQDGDALNCPACGHIWTLSEGDSQPDRIVARDANGNMLEEGDTVVLIKDLKVKGSALTLKIGTRVKGIRLSEGDHNIDCKIDGFGPMKLKSEFVKRA